MQEPYDHDGFTKAIFDTKAVSIWNNEKGPVFWYAAGVPGPFYVNTEKLIGAEAAEKLLGAINDIVSQKISAPEKAALIEKAVMNEYEGNVRFQKIVATMIRDCRTQFGEGYNVISGGERRDWFFSIPFAIESGLPHIYLFKNGEVYSKENATGNILHVADLINNAASYFDKWIPILKESGFSMIGTACVINRGFVGIDKLKDAGVPTCSLRTIDQTFFDNLRAIKLIAESVYTEIDLYFSSKEDWAKRYILSKPELIGKEQLDAKSKERLQSFLQNDPWNLKTNDNEGVFSKLVAALR